MQTSTFALVAITSAAAAAVYATEPCDLSAIQGKLLANGTTWHDSCTANTGVDVFLLTSFPTKDQAKSIMQSRDCVNYINQVNQLANSAIQCETTVGDQTVNFADLLTDFLTGKTGNKTKEVVVGSDSMSGSVSLSSSESGSASESASAYASSESTFASQETDLSSSAAAAASKPSSKKTPADKQGSDKSAKAGSNGGAAVTATFSVVAAAATAVLAFAL
ncbi:unnamed protein product [Phytophthora fragariaefolia]|uniref:Unnamed protein product n=1 Tax=Phytophthora fragariaefolia TaxID=1490495 RepID=A0A9W6X3U3_9STRA|nr:unnamed protein product [Phytophthora fragariaefolia]